MSAGPVYPRLRLPTVPARGKTWAQERRTCKIRPKVQVVEAEKPAVRQVVKQAAFWMVSTILLAGLAGAAAARLATASQVSSTVLMLLDVLLC